jgi:3-hydroxyacyl-CoA dehydrogenase/enoyl-CoA hydratase/3-hydroxybutyryl-CoA epimerase
MQALESARIFEENCLTDVREADVGSILGFGFAPYTGGTLSYIDRDLIPHAASCKVEVRKRP